MALLVESHAENHLEKQFLKTITDPALSWTKNHKLGVDGSLMVANDVPIPRECFAKISESLKRNWPRAARV